MLWHNIGNGCEFRTNSVCVCMCVLKVKEKPSDLRVVPENEPLDSDTEAERNLVERIKSIKQEK